MGAGRAQVSLSPSQSLNNRAVSTRLSEILPFSWETARLGWDLSLSSSLRKSHFPGTSAHSAPALEQSSPAKNCFQTPLQLINKELLVLSQLRAISPYVILFFFLPPLTFCAGLDAQKTTLGPQELWEANWQVTLGTGNNLFLGRAGAV